MSNDDEIETHNLPKELAEKLTAQMEEARLNPETLVSSESRRKRNG